MNKIKEVLNHFKTWAVKKPYIEMDKILSINKNGVICFY